MKLLNSIATACAAAMSIAISILSVAAVAAVLFGSEPTGNFYVKKSIHGAEVCEDVKFGRDRTVYTGDEDRAIELWLRLKDINKPGEPAPMFRTI